MVRGQASKVGDTRVSANGYHYTKTPDKWKLTHHIVAEKEILKRQLKENERVIFRDKNRENLDPMNLAVVIKGSGSASRTRARLTARIQELTAQLEELN
jgi:hypothetical protein